MKYRTLLQVPVEGDDKEAAAAAGSRRLPTRRLESKLDSYLVRAADPPDPSVKTAKRIRQHSHLLIIVFILC